MFKKYNYFQNFQNFPALNFALSYGAIIFIAAFLVWIIHIAENFKISTYDGFHGEMEFSVLFHIKTSFFKHSLGRRLDASVESY